MFVYLFSISLLWNNDDLENVDGETSTLMTNRVEQDLHDNVLWDLVKENYKQLFEVLLINFQLANRPLQITSRQLERWESSKLRLLHKPSLWSLWFFVCRSKICLAELLHVMKSWFSVTTPTFWTVARQKRSSSTFSKAPNS